MCNPWYIHCVNGGCARIVKWERRIVIGAYDLLVRMRIQTRFELIWRFGPGVSCARVVLILPVRRRCRMIRRPSTGGRLPIIKLGVLALSGCRVGARDVLTLCRGALRGSVDVTRSRVLGMIDVSTLVDYWRVNSECTLIPRRLVFCGVLNPRG
jgi:hypothetical protein